jgi:hypothetical protein
VSRVIPPDSAAAEADGVAQELADAVARVVFRDR